MRALLVLLAGLLALPTTAAAQDQHLLFLGNSYTAGNDLASVVEGWLEAGYADWPDVRVERNTPGGYRLPQHLADAEGANQQVATWMTPGNEPWDTVILQDQSQVPGFYETTPVWIESRDAAIELHGLVGALPADTMLFMTWGRRVGDDTNPQVYPDFTTMQDRLTAGYLTFAEAAANVERPVYVAPVGEAFRLVHDQIAATGADPATQGTLFWDLYTNDGSHPSGAGTYLAAAVFFGALTGQSPVGVAAPAGSLSADQVTTLQQAAHDAVFETTLPLVWPWGSTGDDDDSGDDDDATTADDNDAGDDDDTTTGIGQVQTGCGACAQSGAGASPWLALLAVGLTAATRRARSRRGRRG